MVMRLPVLACLLGTALASPALAQMAVIDAANIAQTTLTAARALQQIEQLRSANGTLLTTLQSIAHRTGVGGIASAVRGFSRQSGPASGDLAGMMGGRGGEWGTAGSRMAEDRLYSPTNRDEWAIEMERRERVTANAKAMIEAAYLDAEEQLAALDALQAEVEAAPDGTAGTAQSSAIALASQRLAANQDMLRQAQTMLAADDRVTRQREEQAWRRDVDDRLRRLTPALGGW